MGLMSEAHKHNLNRNRVKLMKNVQSLSSIFQFLREDYTLTEEMQEEIQVTLQNCSALCASLLKFILICQLCSCLSASFCTAICHRFVIYFSSKSFCQKISIYQYSGRSIYNVSFNFSLISTSQLK